jgi:hypothetical protein
MCDHEIDFVLAVSAHEQSAFMTLHCSPSHFFKIHFTILNLFCFVLTYFGVTHSIEPWMPNSFYYSSRQRR